MFLISILIDVLKYFLNSTNIFKYYLHILKTVEFFIFKMEITQKSRIQISSPLYNKKLHRLPVKRSNVQINNFSININNSGKITNELIHENHIKINLNENNENESDVELLFEPTTDTKPITTSISESCNISNLRSFLDSIPTKTSSNSLNETSESNQNKSHNHIHHIHRHRHARHRNYKIKNIRDKKEDLNESFDDPDSISIPAIQFNAELSNYVPFINFESNLDRESNDFDLKDNNLNNLKVSTDENVKKENYKFQNSSLKRSQHLHRSTPNLTSISYDDIDSRSLIQNNDIDEKTNLVNNNYPSNLELSTNNCQIYNDFQRNDLILNKTKLINNNLNNLINNNNYKKCLQRYKLINEGDVHLCKLAHSRNVFSKILSSKLLRRWKAHHIILKDTGIYSTTVS